MVCFQDFAGDIQLRTRTGSGHWFIMARHGPLEAVVNGGPTTLVSGTSISIVHGIGIPIYQLLQKTGSTGSSTIFSIMFDGYPLVN